MTWLVRNKICNKNVIPPHLPTRCSSRRDDFLQRILHAKKNLKNFINSTKSNCINFRLPAINSCPQIHLSRFAITSPPLSRVEYLNQPTKNSYNNTAQQRKKCEKHQQSRNTTTKQAHEKLAGPRRKKKHNHKLLKYARRFHFLREMTFAWATIRRVGKKKMARPAGSKVNIPSECKVRFVWKTGNFHDAIWRFRARAIWIFWSNR